MGAWRHGVAVMDVDDGDNDEMVMKWLVRCVSSDDIGWVTMMTSYDSRTRAYLHFIDVQNLMHDIGLAGPGRAGRKHANRSTTAWVSYAQPPWMASLRQSNCCPSECHV